MFMTLRKIAFTRTLPIVLGLAVSLASVACASKGAVPGAKAPDPIEEFLKVDPESKELFRVVLMSDKYRIAQMSHQGTIKRMHDPGGDSFMAEELIKLDKIDEVRFGTVKIWLYPTSGKVMKVRPFELTNLLEIDKLLVDDVQRWSFEFPGGSVQPQSFSIRYMVVLRKKLTDGAILDQIRKDMSGKKTWR